MNEGLSRIEMHLRARYDAVSRSRLQLLHAGRRNHSYREQLQVHRPGHLPAAQGGGWNTTGFLDRPGRIILQFFRATCPDRQRSRIQRRLIRARPSFGASATANLPSAPSDNEVSGLKRGARPVRPGPMRANSERGAVCPALCRCFVNHVAALERRACSCEKDPWAHDQNHFCASSPASPPFLTRQIGAALANHFAEVLRSQSGRSESPERGGPVRTVNGRCESDEVAPGAYDVVLRGGSPVAAHFMRALQRVLSAPVHSYHESPGSRHPRAQRGLLTRPALQEVHRYREHVDAAVLRLIEDATTKAPKSVGPLIVLGQVHEQQHQEPIVADAFTPCSLVTDAPGTSSLWRRAASVFMLLHRLNGIDGPSGLVGVGHAGGTFAFDNETPQHRCWLALFQIADRLVTLLRVMSTLSPTAAIKLLPCGCPRAGRWFSPIAGKCPPTGLRQETLARPPRRGRCSA